MWKKYFLNGIITDYSVSDNGQVRRDSTKRILSQSKQQGYYHVTLSIEHKQKRMRVHRMVAETFIPNPENKPYVNHIDLNRGNNKVINLEWVTPKENTLHAVKMGAMKPRTKSVIQYSLDGVQIATFESATEAARKIGGSQNKICLCCERKRKTSNDYQWRYADDIQDVTPTKKLYITGKKVAQCDEQGNIINIFSSFREAARAVSGTSSAISRVCSGLNVRHKGFKWKIVEEIVQ